MYNGYCIIYYIWLTCNPAWACLCLFLWQPQPCTFPSLKDLPHTNIAARVQFETSDTGHVLDILKQVSVERLGTVHLHTVWLLFLKNIIR